MRKISAKFVLLSAIVAVCWIGLASADDAVTPGATAAVTVQEDGLVPDPFLDQSEITSVSETGAFCICAYGINCCGDLPRPNRCSIGGSCWCNYLYQCVAPIKG